MASAVPDVVAPPPHHPRFPLLDGMRAIKLWGPELSFLPLLAATIAITIPIAAASYYLLERPLLRFKR